MNKKIKFFLFLTCISFFSCNRSNNTINYLSNLDTDFPITEKLEEFKLVNRYDILENDNYMIDDSILWYFPSSDEYSVGYCYNLNTGEKLSTIATKGHAANEFTSVYFSHCKILGDSIQFYKSTIGLKIFSKKDIISNKPMNERKFSATTKPDSINIGRMLRLPNGSLLATIRGTQGKNPLPEEYTINNKSIAIINDNEVKGYETINYDSFDMKMSNRELEYNTPNFMIKNAYANCDIELKGNDIAVFSILYQFILYTFDLNIGKVIKEKRYTDMRSSGVSHMTANDMEMRIGGPLKSNDKYIFCIIRGYLNKEDKELKLKKRALFVFDWDLNPIKKFDLPIIDDCFYLISNDCNSIYKGVFSDEDGLTLSKADLKI